jgi:hypothetical protein
LLAVGFDLGLIPTNLHERLPCSTGYFWRFSPSATRPTGGHPEHSGSSDRRQGPCSACQAGPRVHRFRCSGAMATHSLWDTLEAQLELARAPVERRAYQAGIKALARRIVGHRRPSSAGSTSCKLTHTPTRKPTTRAPIGQIAATSGSSPTPRSSMVVQ